MERHNGFWSLLNCPMNLVPVVTLMFVAIGLRINQNQPLISIDSNLWVQEIVDFQRNPGAERTL